MELSQIEICKSDIEKLEQLIDCHTKVYELLATMKLIKKKCSIEKMNDAIVFLWKYILFVFFVVFLPSEIWMSADANLGVFSFSIGLFLYMFFMYAAIRESDNISNKYINWFMKFISNPLIETEKRKVSFTLIFFPLMGAGIMTGMLAWYSVFLIYTN
jgi:hypothetical protein